MSSASRPSKARRATSASWRSRPIGHVVGALGQGALEPGAVQVDGDIGGVERRAPGGDARPRRGPDRRWPRSRPGSRQLGRGLQLDALPQADLRAGRPRVRAASRKAGTASSRPLIASSRSASGAWSRANSRNSPSPMRSRASERRSQMRSTSASKISRRTLWQLEVALEADRRRQRRRVDGLDRPPGGRDRRRGRRGWPRGRRRRGRRRGRAGRGRCRRPGCWRRVGGSGSRRGRRSGRRRAAIRRRALGGAGGTCRGCRSRWSMGSWAARCSGRARALTPIRGSGLRQAVAPAASDIERVSTSASRTARMVVSMSAAVTSWWVAART